MADVYGKGNFAGIVNIAGLDAGEQTAVNAEIDKIIALITPQSDTAAAPSPHPDFDMIHPATADLLLAELTTLKTAVTAGL
jgi:hypothetical protein